jgi:dipeptidyl aminopeptidase/acylaminoacyl peptidase
MRRLIPFALVVPLAGCSAAADVAPQSTSSLTIDQLIDIKHPSNPAWSPDGRRVAFIWDRAGVSNLYVADATGAGGEPRALTTFTDGAIGAPFWSADGERIHFAREGDLWQAVPTGGPATAVWTTPAPEADIVPAPDGQRVAFVRPSRGTGAGPGKGRDLWVRSLTDGAEVRLVHDDSSISSPSWAPDGRHLAYSAGARSIRHEQTPEYSGAKIIFTVTERTPGQTFVVSSGGGRPSAIGTPGGGGVRWVDAAHVVFDRQSPDYKRRATYVASITGGSPRLLREDVDDKFWSIPGNAGAAAQPSPDGKWVAFLSDRDGWDHLYVMAAAGGEAVQVTKGAFEAWRPVWSKDGTRVAFDANVPGQPGTRHVGVATVADAGTGQPHVKVSMITSGRGTNIAPEWSPDGTRLVFQHTDPQHSADLFVVDARPGAAPVRLSDSMPAAIDRSRLVEPELVTYPGPDGQPVPAWLLVPKGLDRSKRHPAVVWIHGDGVNQNYDGWHVQRNYAVYYSFHQYLLQQGYVVLAPDYRGSIGYGKAWRQGVHQDVGGQDARDAWMAAHYLKTLPYVDGDRLGVWGLSYGGFFTLIAVTDQPMLYRAAVDVSGVVDYAMYYQDPYHGGWTVSRIGTPEQNPAVYAQASPLSRIDRLVRPLLILHGTSDVNVPYLHSVRLADELLKKGKGPLFDFVTYPGEFHYFTRAHVLTDAWTRVDAFFARHLKGGPTPATD